MALRPSELLKVKGIEFDLPITKDNLKNFYGLVGRSPYSGFAGVYVFTHKASKSMYVGSSNLLRRRMEYYFKDFLNEARFPSEGAGYPEQPPPLRTHL